MQFDNTTFEAIQGDFSIAALSMRLLAPDFESLVRFFPDAREETKIEHWEAFSSRINWSEEAQSIQYVGNFVHEFIHLLQHTTLFQCMSQVDFYHGTTWSIIQNLRRLREAGKAWPLKLPLFDWLALVDEDAFKEVWGIWHLSDFVYNLYLGNEKVAMDFCETANTTLAKSFVDPFNPRISHLHLGSEVAGTFHYFKDIPITTKMLLESQATILEYRFLETFYGHDIALSLHPPQIRIDYDVLEIISRAKGMLYWTPVIIDWAFEGHAYYPDHTPNWKIEDYSAFHPPWRFIRLFNAALSLEEDRSFSNIVQNFVDLKHRVFKLAGIRLDAQTQFLDWIDSLNDSIVKKVFKRNIKFRIERPETYAFPEAFFSAIRPNTYAPIVLFRDNPLINHHNELYNPKDDVLDPYELSWFTKRAFEVNRFIEGIVPKCPYCQGVDYVAPDGTTIKRFPPAGRTGRIAEDLIVTNDCSCSWAYEFKDVWGTAPHDIQFVSN